MATAYKVLGQSKPAAGTLTTLYTVPSSTEAVISSLTIANIKFYNLLIKRVDLQYYIDR